MSYLKVYTAGGLLKTDTGAKASDIDAAGGVLNSDTSTTDMSFVIDEDTMVSDSNTKLPTQQSLKAYVDNGSEIIRHSIAINGDFSVDQVGDITSIANNDYFSEMWRHHKTGVMVGDISRVTTADSSVLSTGHKYNIKYATTTTDTSLAAADYLVLFHKIEGHRFLPLAGRKTVCLFKVKSSVTGIFCIAFRNGGSDRTFVREYTINAANTWETKVVEIDASPDSGTWDYGSGLGLTVIFCLGAGTDRQTTAGAWQTGSFYATANQVNLSATASGTFEIANFEVKDFFAPRRFTPVPIQQNWLDCLRYFEIVQDATFAGWNTTLCIGQLNYIEKRSVPDITLITEGLLYGANAAKTVTSIGNANIRKNGCRFDMYAGSLITDVTYNWRAGKISIEARL